MIYTALLMPIRVAFMTDNDDNVGWVVIDWFIDGIFLLDIFITFFSSYFNDDDELIISWKVSLLSLTLLDILKRKLYGTISLAGSFLM